MKPFLVMSAPIATRSGYGDHARDLLRSLIAMDKYDILILSQRWGNLPENALGPDDEDISRLIHKGQNNQLPKQPDIWIQVTIPNEFQAVGKYNIGITAGIETTICDPSWIEGLNRMDLNIVPSQHAKNVFINTTYDKMDNNTKQKVGTLKCEKPVEVLFEGLDLEVFNKTKEIPKTVVDTLADIPEQFCFLMVGHWLNGDFGHDRKDIATTIKTFCETFKNKGRKKPALIFKSGTTFSVRDREELLKKIQTVRNLTPGAPNVYLIFGDMDAVELNGLYNHPKVKAMVSFTHGEGYGRPLQEFAITGKPVIAPNWSGHIDFLKHSILLPGELKQVHPSVVWDKVVLKESSWFYVNAGYASNVMKEVFKNYKKFDRGGKKQATFIRKNFSLKQMTEEFKDLMNDVKVVQQVPLQLPKLNPVKLPKLSKVEK